ncbi:MAG: hypothetical protein RLZZ241_590 [Bacteroidota bacterium]|jgi:uncharacterized protein YbjT (DUF2867 family)
MNVFTEKTAVVFGATGLIGRHLLTLLIQDPLYKEIIVVTRGPMEIEHYKIFHKRINFDNPKAIKDAIPKESIVFSAIGTTNAKVKGNKEIYRTMDHDITLNIARGCLENGAFRFLYVSSSGANPESSNFYLRLKGEIDVAVTALNLKSALIFRPSLLLGTRKEFRFGEKIAQLLMPIFSFAFPKQMKPIPAKAVAKVMIQLSKSKYSGTVVIENSQQLELADLMESNALR